MTNSSPTAYLNGERSPLRQTPNTNANTSVGGGGGEQSMRDSEAGDSSRANTSLNHSNGDSHRRLFAMDHSKGVLFKLGLDFIVLLTGESYCSV